MRKITILMAVLGLVFTTTAQVTFNIIDSDTSFGFTVTQRSSGWSQIPDLVNEDYIFTGPIILVDDGSIGLNDQGYPISAEGCSNLTNDLSNSIALIYRNSCNFDLKIFNAQKAGAIAAIIINRENTLMNMGAGDFGDSVIIPSIFIDSSAGVYINNLLSQGSVEAEIKSRKVITDVDGNVYTTVNIGNQEWMVENLKTSKYNNGDAIPNVTDDIEFRELSSPAWCWYNNDSASYNSLHGKLYNYYAVADTNSKNICPVGWHVPSYAEWTTLIDYVEADGYEGTAGYALKATEGWNHGADSYGFKVLPSLSRYLNGTFSDYYAGNFWSSTNSWCIVFSLNNLDIDRHNIYSNQGFSVRCIKDGSSNELNNDTIIGDTSVYSTDYYLFIDTIFLENTDTFRKFDNSGDSILMYFVRIMYNEAYNDTIEIIDTVLHDIYDTTTTVLYQIDTQVVIINDTNEVMIDVYDTTYVSVEDTLVITMSSDTAVGIDFLTTEVNVYPNPASTQLNVEIDMSGDYTVSLTNINGQMVFTQANVVDDLQIDISDFTQGLYFITITDNDGVLKAEERKIVIE